jgi:ATP-dependent DNA helicase RecQ
LAKKGLGKGTTLQSGKKVQHRSKKPQLWSKKINNGFGDKFLTKKNLFYQNLQKNRIVLCIETSQTMPTPQEVLKRYWGYDAFRPLQEDIINSVLQGRDTLALLPTGGGKSICFQVPALCREGVCVVVSPLIALMKDQVYNLKKRDIAAEAIYSGMRYQDIDRILDNAVYGGLKFLYLSPERLKTEIVQVRLQKMNIGLLAIDEAHCISQWGYDFRPPYLEIANIRTLLDFAVPIIALTATATPEVVADIQYKLAFRQKNVFQKSFERPNLTYVVSETEDKIGKTIDILRKVAGSGIVYVRNRRMTKEIAFELNRLGINADFYHAGLTTEERSKKQDAWINDKTRIMVSTNAFGMGIDKPNVRIVVHIEPPDNIENYFQEAGRGGRDEKRSYAVLLYGKADKQNLAAGFESTYPELKEVRQVYRALGSYFQLGIGGGEGESYEFDIIEFSKNYRFDDQIKVLASLKLLEQAGWLTLSEAIFIPSSVFVKVNRETLYSFQLRHKELDALIKALTRGYPSIFSHATNISEKTIAHFLKISENDVLKQLQYLQNEAIIDFSLKKEKPQITFLKPRMNVEDLTFDTQLYKFRKERQKFRIEKIIAYCEDKRCRSLMLLEYFGQAEAKPCGGCDVCLSKQKESNNADDEFNRYKEKIIFLLRKERLTISQVVNSFATQRQPMILKTLEYMIDEGFLEKEGEYVKFPYNHSK